MVEHPSAQRLQRGQALTAHAIGGVSLGLVGHLLQAGQRRREDDAGVVAQLVGQTPAVGQLGAPGRGLVVQDERDAGVAQRVDAGGDRQLGVAAQRGQPVVVDAELRAEVERTGAGGELDHRVEAVDRLPRRASVFALDQARDVLVEDVPPDPGGDHVDPLLAVEQPRDVGVVKQSLGAGQTERGAGDDDRLGIGPAAVGGGGSGQRAGARLELGHQPGDGIAGRSGRGTRR